ncbi:MAG: hypothetical protein AAFY60_07415, partial [Myxococcota bacterium]
ENLRYSLSAADLHVVTMGDAMVGITHPCKIYTAMAVGRPLLAVAPERSHVGRIVSEGGGWRVDQGDVDGAVTAIEAFRESSASARAKRADLNLRLLNERFDSATLRRRMAQLLSL